MEDNKESVKKEENNVVEHVNSSSTAHEHSDKGHEPTNQTANKKEEVKPVKTIKPKVKKEVVVVKAPSVHMSKRHGMYICSFIKGKSIDNAMKDLEQVILIKKAVPFKGEIPHRKGKGMMSGRYPVVASKLFITMLKNLKGSAIFNDMDIERTKISSAYTNWASRPQRRGGQKGKRASVIIEAREVNK